MRCLNPGSVASHFGQIKNECELSNVPALVRETTRVPPSPPGGGAPIDLVSSIQVHSRVRQLAAPSGGIRAAPGSCEPRGLWHEVIVACLSLWAVHADGYRASERPRNRHAHTACVAVRRTNANLG